MPTCSLGRVLTVATTRQTGTLSVIGVLLPGGVKEPAAIVCAVVIWALATECDARL